VNHNFWALCSDSASEKKLRRAATRRFARINRDDSYGASSELRHIAILLFLGFVILDLVFSKEVAQ
jgi:hypothetical protein